MAASQKTLSKHKEWLHNLPYTCGVLYFVQKQRKQAVVPSHLRPQILRETHSGSLAGANCLFNRRRWWPNMYADCVKHCKSCVECAVVRGLRRAQQSPLHPIPDSFTNVGRNRWRLSTTWCSSLSKTERQMSYHNYVLYFYGFLDLLFYHIQLNQQVLLLKYTRI